MFKYEHDADKGELKMRAEGNVIDLAAEVIHMIHNVYEQLEKGSSDAAEAFKAMVTKHIEAAFWDDEQFEEAEKLNNAAEKVQEAAKKMADTVKDMSAEEIDMLFKEMLKGDE